LECGSLLPLLTCELARALSRKCQHSRHGQQAGLSKSGSKLPHSKRFAPGAFDRGFGVCYFVNFDKRDEAVKSPARQDLRPPMTV